MCISRRVNKNLINIRKGIEITIFFNCQYVQRSSFTTTLKTYHVSDDITTQVKLLTTVNNLLISLQSFKLLKEFERVYIFLIDQTPNWDTSNKHTNNINLKKLPRKISIIYYMISRLG